MYFLGNPYLYTKVAFINFTLPMQFNLCTDIAAVVFVHKYKMLCLECSYVFISIVFII